MEQFEREINYFGICRDNMFMKFKNRFVYDEDKSNIYFKPNKQGQFDYMVYVVLLSLCNYRYEFTTTINKLVKYMGYKPKSGEGKINDKVKQSLNRLSDKYYLLDIEYEGNIIDGIISIPKAEGNFFKMNIDNICKILGKYDFKLNKNDFSNKYKDKPKAIYVYSYLLCLMGEHDTTSALREKWFGCYPSSTQICKDCNISDKALTKLLRYFEYDDLIYTTNMGRMVDSKGFSINGNNYYTNELKHVPNSYIFMKGYYDLRGYKYNKPTKHVRYLLNDINNIFSDVFKSLNDEDKIIQFKEHVYSMFENIVNKYNEVDNAISMEKYKEYRSNNDDVLSRFRDTTKTIPLLYLADKGLNGTNIEILTHFRNKLIAITYLYNIK